VSQIAIRGVGLGKRYTIGERARYVALRDILANFIKAPTRLFGSNRENGNNRREQIWALRDVSFEIQEGEVVGLIGRNGAGKTTLLKILSRVTRPTTGFAEVQGRMGTLLEVGTGFHPELTGRENVFLSGAILGMSKREMDRKFDEMVAFAEVEKFIDTPLKHYSTGMQMRLAFAVAAHLEPEILLVDEVLAVGDAAFQKKCLGKIGDVARGGRTIVLVSHQMNQIRRMCERVLWIDAGELRLDGAAEAVIGAYEQSALRVAQLEQKELPSHDSLWFSGWEVVEPCGTESNIVSNGSEPVSIRIRLHSRQPIRHGLVTALIHDARGFLISGWSFDRIQLAPGDHDVFLTFPDLPLRPGAYSIYFSVHDDNQRNYNQTLVPALIIEGMPVTHFLDEWAGVLNIPCSLESRQIEIGTIGSQ
jgi:lipopolysaccharide transport system ATP-binding protein